jgi:hypothetical protein
MNCLVFVVLFTVSSISGYTQCVREDVRVSRLRGQVVEQRNGNPIAGVVISVKKSDPAENKPISERKTDSAGNFDLSNIRPGKYILSVTFPYLDGIITRLTVTRRQRSGNFLKVNLAPPDLSGTDSCEGDIKVFKRLDD